MSDEIKPCPFCNWKTGSLTQEGEYQLECDDCAAKGPTAKSKPTALAAWNRRAQPEAQLSTNIGDVMEAVDYHAKACVDRAAGEPLDTARSRANVVTSVLDFASQAAQSEPAMLALENCRLFAARHRKEEWSKTIIRFCAEGGATGSPLREAQPEPAQVAALNELTAEQERLGLYEKAEPAAPAGEVVVTTRQDGTCVAVTRQDEDGRILSVIWQASDAAPSVAPEPETDAWLIDVDVFQNQYAVIDLDEAIDDLTNHAAVATPLYAHPPRAPLTDAEIDAAIKHASGRWDGSVWVFEDADIYPFVRSISLRQQAASPLTEAEIVSLARDTRMSLVADYGKGPTHIVSQELQDFARAIEAAHGIRAGDKE